MEPFTVVEAVAAPLIRDDIDTDAIFPSRFARDASADLARALFADWRFDADGAEVPDFVLNRPTYRGAGILVCGANFGCGSSREHAVWALAAFGIRCVIGESFADIFEGNAYQNGLLPLTLGREDLEALGEALASAPRPVVVVDLRAESLRGPGGFVHRFAVDADRRRALLEGLDDIDATLTHASAIESYQSRQRALRPWLQALADLDDDNT